MLCRILTQLAGYRLAGDHVAGRLSLLNSGYIHLGHASPGYHNLNGILAETVPLRFLQCYYCSELHYYRSVLVVLI